MQGRRVRFLLCKNQPRAFKRKLRAGGYIAARSFYCTLSIWMSLHCAGASFVSHSVAGLLGDLEADVAGAHFLELDQAAALGGIL